MMLSRFEMFVLTGWLVSLVLSVVLSRRYSPTRAWAWLAVMLAFPWLGLVLYLMLGENPLGRRRIVRYRKVIEGLGDSDRRSVLEPHIYYGQMDSRLAAIARMAQHGGALGPVGGNEAVCLTDSDAVMDSLIRDIDRAEHHVHLVFYIFHNDQTGQRVADALGRAAARGVQCRLLADAVGSRTMLKTMASTLRSGGVEVRDALYVNPFRGRLARIDVRNHRKIAIIDGRVGYLGSWNVCDGNYGNRQIPAGHDVMVRLVGPVVFQLQLLFLEDWSFEARELLAHEHFFPAPRQSGDIIAQALPSGPMYPSAPVRDLAVAAIHQAQHQVCITTPYLVPDDALLLSLRLAAQRGVGIDVIVPEHSNHPVIDTAARSYYRQMSDDGIHIHLFQRGLLHAKIFTVDGMLGMVGSANFDIRSFHLDVEANCLFYSQAFCATLNVLQDDYRAQSAAFSAKSSSYFQRAIEDWTKLISPLF